MDCDKIRAALDLFSTGRLTKEAAGTVRDHLGVCADCRAHLRQMDEARRGRMALKRMALWGAMAASLGLLMAAGVWYLREPTEPEVAPSQDFPERPVQVEVRTASSQPLVRKPVVREKTLVKEAPDAGIDPEPGVVHGVGKAFVIGASGRLAYEGRTWVSISREKNGDLVLTVDAFPSNLKEKGSNKRSSVMSENGDTNKRKARW